MKVIRDKTLQLLTFPFIIKIKQKANVYIYQIKQDGTVILLP